MGVQFDDGEPYHEFPVEDQYGRMHMITKPRDVQNIALGLQVVSLQVPGAKDYMQLAVAGACERAGVSPCVRSVMERFGGALGSGADLSDCGYRSAFRRLYHHLSGRPRVLPPGSAPPADES
jgi:hypothetical protein